MEKITQKRSLHQSATPGRPREFDLSEVLDSAVMVFREKGYNSTSIGDLCQATSLSSGSIYKAFKDKKGFFLTAFDHYVTARNTLLNARLADASSGREQLYAFISLYVDSSKGNEGRTGCMVISALAEITTFDPKLAEPVRKAYQRLEDRVLRIFEKGRVDGSLHIHGEPASIARLLLCMLQGLRLAGKVGYVETDTCKIVNDIMHLLE